jgi:hypothetical protein
MKKALKITALAAVMALLCVMCGGFGRSPSLVEYKNAAGTVYAFRVNKSVRAGDVAELNTLRDGLRQDINDACGRVKGCTVSALTYARDGTKARLMGNGIPLLSDTVTAKDGVFVFDWDKLSRDGTLYGQVSELTFECSEDCTIYAIYVDVPKLADLTVGEGTTGATIWSST